MNCKPGDLAMVVRSYSGLNYGRVVRCIRTVTVQEVVNALRRGGIKAVHDGRQEVYWAIEGSMLVRGVRTNRSIEVPFAPDSSLKPLPPMDDCEPESVDTCQPEEEAA